MMNYIHVINQFSIYDKLVCKNYLPFEKASQYSCNGEIRMVLVIKSYIYMFMCLSKVYSVNE